MAKRFVKYAGTKEQFAAAKDSNVLLSTKYEKSIVLIAGGTSGVPCIYMRGKYINDAEEFLRSIPYVKGVTDAEGKTVVTGGSAALIPFLVGNSEALDGQVSAPLLDVTVDSNGVTYSVSDSFVDYINDIATSTQDLRLDLGEPDSTSTSTAFGKIAKLAADVAALGGDSGTIAQQIEAAITAALGSGGDIAMEIENQLDSLENSLMGAGLNGQTDGKVKSAIDAAINKLDGTPEDGTNVKVKVTQTDGKVTGVTVDESGLTTSLSGKADLGTDNKILPSQLPDYILGQVLYGGTVNASGVATLSDSFKAKYDVTSLTLSTSNAATYEGVYFIATANATSMAGVTNVITGDWIISNGIAWTKIDNTDAVTSVAGQTGAVTAQQIANAITTTTVGVATKSEVNAKYTKPSSGIPKSDLASAVQTSLGKADSAYQKPSTGIPKSDLASAVQTSLDKADAAAPQSITYTKTEVDNKFAELEAADISIEDGSSKFPNISNVEDALTYLAEMWDWEDISAS